MPPIYIDVGNGLWHCFTHILRLSMIGSRHRKASPGKAENSWNILEHLYPLADRAFHSFRLSSATQRGTCTVATKILKSIALNSKS